MDNKQDKLFYWEVKDFLSKTKNPYINSVKRASSLKEDITKIMSLNSPFYVDKDLVQPRISADIRNSVLPLISLNENSIQRGTPRNVGSSPNITSNLFNLREASSFGSMGGGSSSSSSTRRRPDDERPSWRDRSPENEERYQKNKEDLNKQEEARKEQVRLNVIRTQEDEAHEYGKTNPGGALKMDGTTPADTPENREKLRNFRKERDNENQSTRLADVIARTSKQDPSTLSAKDAAELALAKIMMKGGDMSKPNKELETRIRTKVADRQQYKPEDSMLQGPTESGGNVGDQAKAQSDAVTDAERSRSRAYFDSDTESSFNSSRDATQRDVNQREKDNRAYAAQQAAARYEKMQGTKIQGTNMTYGEFKSNTGRDYDATSKEDSSLVSRQAGAGRYSSAEARDLAGSTDKMINMQRSANDARVAEGGRLTREVDKSAQQLSDYQNNPTIRARENAKDRASLMPRVMAQINTETSKRDRLEADGRTLAAGDKAIKNSDRLAAQARQAKASSQNNRTKPTEYGTSLLSDIMNSGTSKPSMAPGSMNDIDDQIKRLRKGQ